MSEEEIAKLRQFAVKAHKSGRLNDAVAAYRRLIFAMPDDPHTWSNLGSAFRAQKKWHAAEACQRRALDLDPASTIFKGNLANVLKDLDRHEESLALHREVIEKEPGNASARLNFGIVLREYGEHAAALEQFNKAIELNPDRIKTRWDRAMSHLALGHFEEGWRDYEARWNLGELPLRRAHIPRWDGQTSLEGKTVVVTTEQGFGDTIMASRFLPRLKALGATVVLDLKKPLRELMSGIEGVDFITDPDEALDNIDFQYPIMSLLGRFWTGLDDLPPLPDFQVPEASQEKMRALIAPHGAGRLKVGVVWSGSITFKGNRHRAATIEQFLSLAGVPNVQLFSLQKGPLERQLQQSGAEALMVDLGSKLENFSETAAAIQQLDLVIMTDSSVAHLCGSLNEPVWNLLNYVPYWLYLEERADCPWYPSMTLYRQPRFGDWDSVFEKVCTDLAELAARKKNQS